MGGASASPTFQEVVMPIPKPKKGEKKSRFLDRCMRNIGSEYKNDQAAAICYKQWRNKKHD